MTYNKAETAWWEDKLAGQALDIYPDQPMRGFYAYRPSGKAETPLPVALWYGLDGGLRCHVNGKPVDYGLDVWLRSANHPIPHEVYTAVVNGGTWPAEILVTLADGTTESSMTPGKGHNSGDYDKDLVAIGGNIKEWLDRAIRMKKKGAPKTQAEADTMADVMTKLADLVKEADAKRTEEGKPALELTRTINAKWKKIYEPAEPEIKDLRALLRVFDREETKRREDAAAAANAKLAEEAAAAAPKGSAPAADAPAPIMQAAPVRMGSRRAVSTVKRTVCVLDDIKKTADFFLSMETPPPDVVEAIRTQAYKLLRADMKVPGARLDKKESVE